MPMLNVTFIRLITYSLSLIAVVLAGQARTKSGSVVAQERSSAPEAALTIQYLEIVATNVDATVALYSQIYGIAFGDADPNLGGARTANLVEGGMIGIRGPLRDDEQPIVRPYILVEDIVTSVSDAATAGAEIAMPVIEIEGYGQFAIIIQDGIETGLWQLDGAE